MVRERHAQLQQVVGSLSDKVGADRHEAPPLLPATRVKVPDAPCVSQISVVLGRQEKDFLAAYRAHMYNVQKELHEMREKIRRNETVENKSEKIKKLEDERDWYRKEALRLDAFTTSMSKDLKAMRDKLEAIEGDRDWLEKQLKACKKQNKLLRAEIDSRLSAAVTMGMDGGAMLPSFDATPTKLRTSVVPTTGSKRASDVALGGSSTADGLPYLNLDGVAQSPTLVEEREERLKKKLRQLKRELQQKTQELLVARQQRSANGGRDDAGGGARSRLESLFLQCVESVKDEVARRRSNPTEDKSAKSALAVHRQPPRVLLPEATARNQRREDVDEFTSADRVRLIERLLAHNEVLTLLYAHLFPSESEAAPAAAATRDSTSLNARYASSEDVDAHSRPTSPTLHSSESLANARTNADAGDVLGQDGSSSQRALTPVGSGAAFASAARGSQLPLDSFTKDYLRAMYVHAILAFMQRRSSGLTRAHRCPGGRKRTRSADMRLRMAR